MGKNFLMVSFSQLLGVTLALSITAAAAYAGGFIDERLQKPSTVQIPKTGEPKALHLPPAPAAGIELVKGKPVDQQFGSYARTSEWVLIWEASEFVLDNNVSIEGDFETAFTAFLKATNESGSRLRATFYRGNKTVRVQEF